MGEMVVCVGWWVWIPAFAGMTVWVGREWVTLTPALSLRERGLLLGVEEG